ncbi:MAG: hypothetical protein UU08_C0019G0008 [Candidatus Uhrbacteria bacterium GW2011_GWE2_40_58]|nr:MAG: hypothetical protein UT94_C0046G0002 [Candidatus Uhrbacteria bacterium GW2011_GWF2_40_263]KKR67352.1 MAG: hypothetical protein UU08_C0019G0008 [Candidatus Uhrbacteria bacterium GW2011_GWE2_40_58]
MTCVNTCIQRDNHSYEASQQCRVDSFDHRHRSLAVALKRMGLLSPPGSREDPGFLMNKKPITARISGEYDQ